MKILLFGKNGQLGWELSHSLATLGKLVALGRDEADFSRPESLRKIIQEIDIPVLVVGAKFDLILPYTHSKSIVANSNVRLSTFTKSVHMTFLEYPEKLSRIVDNFVNI